MNQMHRKKKLRATFLQTSVNAYVFPNVDQFRTVDYKSYTYDVLLEVDALLVHHV